MEWTQLKATGNLSDLDRICAIMCMLDPGLQIEDYSDIDKDTCYADLIDEEIMKKDRNIVSVSIYLSEDKAIPEYVAFLKERFSSEQLDAEIELCGVEEEEWATAWKKYYKPLRIGKRLMIVPGWEKYDPKPDDVVVTMDPGLAFGTGTHETTRLCAILLEKYASPSVSAMLDVGTGSGILAICAAGLGVGKIDCCDIDPVAVRVANENIKTNGIESRATAFVSDLLRDVKPIEGGYPLITANIVSDIIRRMAPDVGRYLAPDGVLIVSGVIDEREEEIRGVMEDLGYRVIETAHEKGWCAMALTRA